MIITLICFGILFVGIGLFVFYKVCDTKCCKTTKTRRFCIAVSNSYLDLISGVILVLGAITTFACSMVMLENTISKQVDYEKALYTKKTIEYRIEHKEDNVVGNELLYNDIVEFNNELRNIKYWVNNPWTSWFNNDKVAQLDYIEYEFAAAE